MAYALKKLNGFKFLTIDVDEPVARKWAKPKRRYCWEILVLHHMKDRLETELEPSKIFGGDVHPCLIFEPHDHMKQNDLEEVDLQEGPSPNVLDESDP